MINYTYKYKDIKPYKKTFEMKDKNISGKDLMANFGLVGIKKVDIKPQRTISYDFPRKSYRRGITKNDLTYTSGSGVPDFKYKETDIVDIDENEILEIFHQNPHNTDVKFVSVNQPMSFKETQLNNMKEEAGVPNPLTALRTLEKGTDITLQDYGELSYEAYEEMNNKIKSIINSKKIVLPSKGNEVELDDEGVQKATELVEEINRKRQANPTKKYLKKYNKQLETIVNDNSVPIVSASQLLSEPQISANSTEQVKEEKEEETKEEQKEETKSISGKERTQFINTVKKLSEEISEKYKSIPSTEFIKYKHSKEYTETIDTIKKALTALNISVEKYQELKKLTKETFPTSRSARGVIQKQVNNMLKIAGKNDVGRKSFSWETFTGTLNDELIVKLYKIVPAISKSKEKTPIQLPPTPKKNKANIRTLSDIITPENTIEVESNNPTKKNI